MLFKRLSKLATLLTLFLTLMACEQADQALLSQSSIVYCSEGAPESFNPQVVTSGVTVDATSNQLYNRLIEFDINEHTIIPSLAKSWHVTRDGKKITFYLRKDVEFHATDYFTPTRKLTADDVIFSFSRILDPTHAYYQVSGGKYPFFQSTEFNNLVQEIEKINDYTIRFTLTNANSSFLANLASDFSVILSAEYAEQLSQQNQHSQIDIRPIGTGPFKYKEYRQGSFIRYAAHTKYWEKEIKLKQLVFDITPRPTGRLTKLLAGECDVISYAIAHQEIINRPKLTLDEVTSFNVGYLGFNTQKPPFDNVIVRKAIAHAINLDAILDTIYKNAAERANTIVPKSSWAYSEDIAEQKFDQSYAKELLAQAGYENGFEMDVWAMPVQRPYNPDALTMAKLIQDDLKDIGINVNIVTYEWSTFLRRVSKGEHQSVLLGWSADNADPDNFFTPLLSCTAAEIGSNRTFWCNEEYDDLLQQALKTTNVIKRKKLYLQALKLVEKNVPLVPIAHSKRFQARKNKISGQLLRPFGGISFKEAVKN